MELYLVDGMIKNAEAMTDQIMEEHKAYTQKAMDHGMTLMAGLKSDMSGAVFLMKGQTQDEIEAYLANEPFKKHGIQEYKITKFEAHFIQSSMEQWKDA